MWECPECRRQFARQRQAHECSPAMTIEEYFATGPPWERPIYDAVVAHLDALGPMHVEPVSVGIFVKSTGTFIQLRPTARFVNLWLPLTRALDHPKVTRKPVRSGDTVWNIVRLTGPDDVDDELRAWLSEAYADFG